MGIPLYVICCFSLVAFNIFSLYLIFDSLINMCLSVWWVFMLLFHLLHISLSSHFLNLLCLGSPFHRLQVPNSRCFWCLPPVGKVGSLGCLGFLVEGTDAVFWWMRLDLVFLVSRTMSGVIFLGCL